MSANSHKRTLGTRVAAARYSQSDAYIEKLVAENKFEIVCHDQVTVRIEKEVPIPGRIFVLRAAV